MVVVCVLLLHTHNNSSVTLWFVNIIVVLFPLSYLVCDIRLINNSRRRVRAALLTAEGPVDAARAALVSDFSV